MFFYFEFKDKQFRYDFLPLVHRVVFPVEILVADNLFAAISITPTRIALQRDLFEMIAIWCQAVDRYEGKKCGRLIPFRSTHKLLRAVRTPTSRFKVPIDRNIGEETHPVFTQLRKWTKPVVVVDIIVR